MQKDTGKSVAKKTHRGETSGEYKIKNKKGHMAKETFTFFSFCKFVEMKKMDGENIEKYKAIMYNAGKLKLNHETFVIKYHCKINFLQFPTTSI